MGAVGGLQVTEEAYGAWAQMGAHVTDRGPYVVDLEALTALRQRLGWPWHGPCQAQGS